jgi:hypothetical protein
MEVSTYKVNSEDLTPLGKIETDGRVTRIATTSQGVRGLLLLANKCVQGMER